jgi:hypothetical protein
MSAGEPHCPKCGRPVAPGQLFCASCGQSLSAGVESKPSASATDDAWAPVLAEYDASMVATVQRDRQRVDTGFLLMIIAFGLLWIPYVTYLGQLLAFIGIIFFGLGRKAFDERFRRWVVRGVVLIVAGLGVGILAGLIYASEVTSTAMMPGETIPAFIASLQPDLETLVGGAFLTAILLLLGCVCLPYGAADPTTRRVLWISAAVGLTLSALQIAILWPQILPALSNATSGGTLNLGPINALQTEGLELGLMQIIPNLGFLYAYYRIRSRLFPTQGYPPPAGGVPSRYGRTG